MDERSAPTPASERPAVDGLLMAPDVAPLPFEELRWTCEPSTLPFASTADLEPNREIIGQRRAIEAITLGLEMDAPGYNVFLTGFVGTGRNTTIRTVLERLDRTAAAPPDLCYVYNFSSSDHPRALFVPAGKGRVFAEKMAVAVRRLSADLPRVFQEEPYRKGHERIEERYRRKQREVIQGFEKKVQADGFALVQVQAGGVSGPHLVPVIEGEPRFLPDLEEAVSEGKFDAKRFDELRRKHEAHADELAEVVREAIEIETEMRARLSAHDVASAHPIVTACVAAVREEMRDQPEVIAWLDLVEEHALRNLKNFVGGGGDPAEGDHANPMVPYLVNLVVDNGNTKGAPVIVENTPTLPMLFGMLERGWAKDGEAPVDHTKIKAGSLHRANGGYLVLNGADLFAEPLLVWNTIKRTLRTGRLEIPTFDLHWMLGPPALQPEAISISVKVLIIGDVDLYAALLAYDDEFAKIFKIRADFDTEMDNVPESRTLYGAFIQRLVEEEKILPFDRGGVAQVVEQGTRLAGRRNKLSTRFNMIADLVREASHFAKKEGVGLVEARHVERALERKDYRNNLSSERMREMIAEGTVFIDVTGAKIGEVNGLAVYEVGEYAFGLPSKITASVALGNAGIINIEREADLSGRTHDKGVQILGGYLRSKYAQERPLTLSASICFEQSYSGVDGDSASSTELYAILSALADLPLRQDIAVTGSVNQKGEIQPIGGVNEKVEGFFDVCLAKGLAGTQGVLIPKANVPDLMLASRVVDAVRAGRFRIHAVQSIDEGLEILTGVAAGRRVGRNRYPLGTVNGRVESKLRKMAGLMRDYGAHT
ncbi:MAG: ATP-binding protein [bacterium]